MSDTQWISVTAHVRWSSLVILTPVPMQAWHAKSNGQEMVSKVSATIFAEQSTAKAISAGEEYSYSGANGSSQVV